MKMRRFIGAAAAIAVAGTLTVGAAASRRSSRNL